MRSANKYGKCPHFCPKARARLTAENGMCPYFLNRATPTKAARFTRQKEKGMPGKRGGMPFFYQS